MSSPLKKRAKTDTDTNGGGGAPPSEAAPVLVASTSTEEENRIEQIEKSCPLTWNGSDTASGIYSSMDEEASLCLTVGWENDPGEEYLMEKCKEYMDPEKKGSYSQCEGEDVDVKAAEKALRKDGSVDDLFEFTTDGERECFYWSVSCQDKKKLTTEKATKTIQWLFDGDLCTFPVEYDNFGETPFSKNSDDSKKDSVGEKDKTSLSNLKESVLMILKSSTSISHSSWEGLCQTEENSSQIDREDFFFFETENVQKFLLKFSWSYSSG